MLPSTADRLRDIGRLQDRITSIRQDLYASLTPWQRVLVARHPARPTTLDYVEQLFTEFVELHGDRRFADDHAVVAGPALYHGAPVMIVGHQKGSDTKQKIYRNFGYARPEGYRKALRAMQMAEKFSRPIICFVDTPAAYPGIESEERGVAEAIALNLREMAVLDVPVIVVVHGEGGSGGALGIAVGDRVLMHEFAIYSVIPPEGCAAILWRDANRKVQAAEALKITAPDLLGLGIIDEIVPEPIGGAHTAPQAAGELLDVALARALAEVSALSSRGPARPALRQVPRHGPGRDRRGLIVGAAPLWSGSRARATRRHATRLHRRARLVAGHRPPAGHPRSPRPRTGGPLPAAVARPPARSVAARRHGAGGRAAARRHRPARAHRHPRRLRRRRRHLDRDPASRPRAARRRRDALHPRAAARRLRPAAGDDRAAACRRRPGDRLGRLRHPRPGGGPARRRARRRSHHHRPPRARQRAAARAGRRQSQAPRLQLSRQAPGRRRAWR